MKSTLLAILVFGAMHLALGQVDSVFILEEIKITGLDLSKYSSGTVLKRQGRMNSGALSQLSQFTTIHFKDYGNQQLSSISFRGTHASHTNVVWNGLQVNSPTLGQTDFSVWPLFLVDDIVIQYGGGSSLLGSGAIGGSIIMDNSTFSCDTTGIILHGAHGSFGQYDGGIKAIYSLGDHISGESRAFYGRIENDFPLEQGGRQVHAGVKRSGLSQKIGFSYKNGKLFAELAYATNDRNNQPTITSADRSTLLSQNIRAVINNKWSVNNGIHDITIGAIQDKTIFNDSAITTSYRLTRTYSFEKNLSTSFSFRVGGTILNEWAISKNFSNRKRQNQLQIFSSLTFYPLNDLEITTNIREVIHGTKEVFIPSLGMEYNVFGNSNASLQLRGQVSKDFRAPTFNDLFWQPGGNPDLKPERSKNIEAGLDWNARNVSLGLTGFYSDIDDWIQWRQGSDGVWSPENITRVKTKGLEVFSNATKQLNQMTLRASAAYTYVLAENQDIGMKNQLIYVPKHEVNGSLGIMYKEFLLDGLANYTSVRYATLSNSEQSEIDGYLLLNVALGRPFKINQTLLNLKLTSKNILNTNYQVVKNRAMPGRSFLFELTTKF